MPNVVKTYKEHGSDYLEVCPLDACKHPVGPKLHHIFEFPKRQDRDEFIVEALEATAAKDF